MGTIAKLKSKVGALEKKLQKQHSKHTFSTEVSQFQTPFQVQKHIRFW